VLNARQSLHNTHTHTHTELVLSGRSIVPASLAVFSKMLAAAASKLVARGAPLLIPALSSATATRSLQGLSLDKDREASSVHGHSGTSVTRDSGGCADS
jgi:hypothetical protein